MLKGNGLSALGPLPVRFIGGSTGTSDVACLRFMWGRHGDRLNRLTTNAQQKFAATPNGALAPTAFCLPRSSGGMSCYTGVVGGGSVSSAVPAAGYYIGAGLSGLGTMSAAGSALAALAASISGSGLIVLADGSVTAMIAASVGGNGALSGTMISAAGLSAAISGSGSTSASGLGALLAVASLAGDGEVSTAAANMSTALSATLGGVGGANGSIVGVWSMHGDLHGDSSLSAQMRALGWMPATVEGHGAVVGSPGAPASVSASIRNFSDLSPEGLADAVWSTLAGRYNTAGSMGEKVNAAGTAGDPWTKVIEAGLSAEDLIRLIASVLLGKVSGAGTESMAFRDLTDTKDRVVASTDDRGNRLAVEYDVSG